MKSDFTFDEARKKVSKDLAGYSIRVVLMRKNNTDSKSFEDLDYMALLNHITSSFPGIPISIGTGVSECFELSDLDEF